MLILAVAFAARLAFAFYWQARLPPGQQFFFGDSDAYWQLSRAIANDEPYQYLSPDAQVLRTPGYPLLLSGVFLAGGDHPPVMAGRALGAAFGTLAVGIVGWWTTALFEARSGLLAGWIAALYPGAIATSVFILSEAPFCAFMLAHLALWGLAWRAGTKSRACGLAVVGGVMAGCATLIRPSWLLFLPLALVAGLVLETRRARQLALAAAMAVSFAAVMLPWWIRNARVTGHFVATTLQVGASLYDGWNPQADGSSDMSFVPQFVADERAADQAQPGNSAADTFEYRLDRHLRQAALDWARANPGRVLQLAANKLLRVWNVWPNEPSLRRWPIRLLVLGTYVPLLLCALGGAWRYTRGGLPYLLAWLPAVYFSLLHMVFVSSIRYREPAMLALTVLAAGFVSSVLLARAPVSRPAVNS